MAKNKIKLKLEIIALLLMIIATLLGVIFIKDSEIYEVEEDCIYYMDGFEYEVPSGSTMKVNSKSDEVTIIVGKEETEPNGLPLYYREDKKIILVNDLAYYRPSNGYVDIYKLSYFTSLSLDSDNVVTISRDIDSHLETSGFLFDGKNTYVLLQKCTLFFNDHRVTLEPFSYVIVSKGNSVEYMNYEDKQIVFEYCDGDVTIEDNRGLYTLMPDIDILEFGSKQVMLNGNMYAKDLYFEVVDK